MVLAQFLLKVLKFLTETPYNFKARSESQAILPHQKNFWELLMQPVLVWHSQWF